MYTSAYPSFTTNYLTKSTADIKPQDFQAWTTKFAFRSSYNEMTGKNPNKPKKYAIPGYTGHIPGFKSDNLIQMTYTTLTRKQLHRPKLDSSIRYSSVPTKPRALASFEPEFNDNYTFRSHKYGCETLSLGRSSNNSSLKKTISHTSFTPPVSDLNKTSLRISSSQSNLRPSTAISGFTKNSQSFQGAGWLGVTIPSSDKWNTEYRNKLNPRKPIHNPPLRPNTRSLKKNKSFYI